MLNVSEVLDIIEDSGRSPNVLLEQWMEKKRGVEETLEEEERWLKDSISCLLSVISRPE